MKSLMFVAAVLAAGSLPVMAQDAVKADPAHFKVELENAQVRVLRYTLPPGEKTAKHEHLLPHVEIQLTDSTEKTTIGGGKPQTSQNQAGHVEWEGVVAGHVNENVGTTPVSTIVVEIKKKK